MHDRRRVLVEMEAASRLRSHPEAALAYQDVLALTTAVQLACGHLAGFLPPGHPEASDACADALAERRGFEPR